MPRPLAFDLKYGCGCQNRFGIPFWLVGDYTTYFRTYFSGDWDVDWRHGLLSHGHTESNRKSDSGWDGLESNPN